MKLSLPASLLAAIFLLATAMDIRAENPPPICNRVRFQATAGGGQDMVGGKIEGSNVSRTEGFVTLAEIKEAPPAKEWGELKFDNSKVYRYLRCALPRGGQGKMGKVEFYDGDKLLAGEKEGILVHYFLPDAQDERTVGYDLVNAAAQRPAIKPDKGEPNGPIDVTINSTGGR